MKVKDLRELLRDEPDDAEVVIGCYEHDCTTLETSVEGVIHEDDGLQKPRVLLCDSWYFKEYDEDNEHGFKKSKHPSQPST